MDWEGRLITLYLFICKRYEVKLGDCCARMTNYANLRLSDEEVITLYLYGVMEGYRTVKSLYAYADKHLRSWFPELAGYKAFNHRINQVCNVFLPLIEGLCDECEQQATPLFIGLVDAMPIILAHRGRRFHAKVAPEIASNNGYCATKKLFYYGVKLHVVAYHNPGALPIPTCIGLTDAGMSDRKAFEHILPALPENMMQCYADKAYQVEAAPILPQGHLTLLTPVKKKKGQERLDSADSLLSTAISSVRQPIESLFNWINEKTGIQIASKVRSYQGLMVHVFGKLAAGLFMMREKMIAA